MLVYVTAFLDIYPTRNTIKSVETCIGHFKTLAASSVPIALYISPNLVSTIQPILEEYSNVRLITTISLEDLSLYHSYVNHPNYENIQRPIYGNEEKDTIPYLILQNSKPQFLDMTIQTNLFPDATHYAWIDFSIFHIITHVQTIQKLLHIYAYDRKWPSPLLVFPGCHEKNKYAAENLINQPCWRFCGGFFVGDKESIQAFHSKATRRFQWCINTHSVIPWEVNIWASMEIEDNWAPDVYMANHNDSMIVVPNEYNDPAYMYPHASYYNLPILTIAEIPQTRHLPLTLPFCEGYTPSSTSYILYNDIHLLNTRYVNYNLTPQGAYIIHDSSGNLKTRNLITICDADTLEPKNQMFYNTEELPLTVHTQTIQGLEDIRLYIQDNNIKILATQRMYSPNQTNRMLTAKLTLPHGILSDFQILQPPTPTSCEKNWTPLPASDMFIYQWHPYQIGVVKINYQTDTNDLHITMTHTTPDHFARIRGSSVPFHYKNKIWCMVHLSEETCPRTYYHQIVILDSQTYLPQQISQPFRFRGKGIEFCIGFTIETVAESEMPPLAHAWVSHHDKDPVHYIFPLDGIQLFDVKSNEGNI